MVKLKHQIWICKSDILAWRKLLPQKNYCGTIRTSALFFCGTIRTTLPNQSRDFWAMINKTNWGRFMPFEQDMMMHRNAWEHDSPCWQLSSSSLSSNYRLQNCIYLANANMFVINQFVLHLTYLTIMCWAGALPAKSLGGRAEFRQWEALCFIALKGIIRLKGGGL